MGEAELQRLATRLNRPVRSLSAFSQLAPEQLVLLDRAVEEACARRRQNLDSALKQALPAPLRWLVLRILRGRSP